MLYALLIAMPLVGWGMLSAGGYPVVLYGSLHLPEILPHDDQLHAILRMTHTVLAYVFFATILLHVAAALFHALIRRDAVFRAMAGISGCVPILKSGTIQFFKCPLPSITLLQVRLLIQQN
jgi:cytochrome b561